MSAPPDGVQVGGVRYLWPSNGPGRLDPNAGETRRRGAVVFHRWLESHLPAAMALPAVFPDDGLLNRMAGAPERTFLGAVADSDGRDRTACCVVLAPEAIAEAAAEANRTVTPRRMAEANLWLAASRRPESRTDAAVVLAYLVPFRREWRVREAARIIRRVLRKRGEDYPVALADFSRARPHGRPTYRIRDAFMRAALNAIGERMPAVSATGRAGGNRSGNDGASLIADEFGVTWETVARAGIKHRHDREPRP